MSVSTAIVASVPEPLPLVGLRALITQIESKLVCAREGRSTYFASRTIDEYLNFRDMERECHERLPVLREEVRLRSRKAPRRVGRKTSFYDGKKTSMRKRRRDSEDDDNDEDEGDSCELKWTKVVERYQVVMERSYRYLSLRSMVGQRLSPGEAGLLVKSSAFVEEDDEEKLSVDVCERLKQSTWVRWLLSPSGPYAPEVAGLVEHGSDRVDVLGHFVAGQAEIVSDPYHGNVANCVCPWSDCSWLTHTLGSPEQRSCAWLSANAARYGLVAFRLPDDEAIRAWLATPDGTVERMSAKRAARVERVRRSAGVDMTGRDASATDGRNGVCDLGWQGLDVVSNTGWRKVLYKRAAEAADEAAAAEALEEELLAGNTFNV
jgi:hypothetical protein